jgi:hypothetical protein
MDTLVLMESVLFTSRDYPRPWQMAILSELSSVAQHSTLMGAREASLIPAPTARRCVYVAPMNALVGWICRLPATLSATVLALLSGN